MRKIIAILALGMMAMPTQAMAQMPPAQNGGTVTKLKSTLNYKNGDREVNYIPKLVGTKCITNHLWSSPEEYKIPHDKPHKARHEYDAVPLSTGGVKCVGGKWYNDTVNTSGSLNRTNEIIMIVKGVVYRER